MSAMARSAGRSCVVTAIVGVLNVLAGCGGSGADESVASTPEAVAAERCVVRLHGKGGVGQEPELRDGVATLSPDGNADGWGGRQWLYFPDGEYEAARRNVASAIEAAGCQLVVVHGFSNGASFAAKLYCRGETFGDRLVGVVIDDPVTDDAGRSCAPDPTVVASLYWTSALELQAPAGTECASIDWTCEGGASIGIEAYAASLGLSPRPSPVHEHAPFSNAPELSEWLA